MACQSRYFRTDGGLCQDASDIVHKNTIATLGRTSYDVGIHLMKSSPSFPDKRCAFVIQDCPMFGDATVDNNSIYCRCTKVSESDTYRIQHIPDKQYCQFTRSSFFPTSRPLTNLTPTLATRLRRVHLSHRRRGRFPCQHLFLRWIPTGANTRRGRRSCARRGVHPHPPSIPCEHGQGEFFFFFLLCVVFWVGVGVARSG